MKRRSTKNKKSGRRSCKHSRRQIRRLRKSSRRRSRRLRKRSKRRVRRSHHRSRRRSRRHSRRRARSQRRSQRRSPRPYRMGSIDDMIGEIGENYGKELMNNLWSFFEAEPELSPNRSIKTIGCCRIRQAITRWATPAMKMFTPQQSPAVKEGPPIPCCKIWISILKKLKQQIQPLWHQQQLPSAIFQHRPPNRKK